MPGIEGNLRLPPPYCQPTLPGWEKRYVVVHSSCFCIESCSSSWGWFYRWEWIREKAVKVALLVLVVVRGGGDIIAATCTFHPLLLIGFISLFILFF